MQKGSYMCIREDVTKHGPAAETAILWFRSLDSYSKNVRRTEGAQADHEDIEAAAL